MHLTQSRLTLGLLSLILAVAAAAAPPNLAPGFEKLAKGSSVVVIQPDLELFSISAGGVQEPRADWTEAATRFARQALLDRTKTLGAAVSELSEADHEDLAEIVALQAAVARSIGLHHSAGLSLQLPTKNGLLDWSLDDAVAPMRAKANADYALFLWMRDSYASAERKVAMVAMALLGVGMTGGFQVGYASLVDLRTGRIMWFNQLVRGSGDLREAEPAAETIDSLLKNFPTSQ